MTQKRMPAKRGWTWAPLALGLGLMSCVGSEPAQAQPRIQVLMINGETWETPLPEVRKMTFQDPHFVFTLANGQTRQIPHTEVRRITFGVPNTTGASRRPAVPEPDLAATVSEGKATLNVAMPKAATLRLEVLSLDGVRVRLGRSRDVPMRLISQGRPGCRARWA